MSVALQLNASHSAADCRSLSSRLPVTQFFSKSSNPLPLLLLVTGSWSLLGLTTWSLSSWQRHFEERAGLHTLFNTEIVEFFCLPEHCNLSDDIQQSCLTVTISGTSKMHPVIHLLLLSSVTSDWIWLLIHEVSRSHTTTHHSR